MTSESRARFAELMEEPVPDLALACLLVSVEVQPDLDVDAELTELTEIALDAADDVPIGATPHQAAVGLRSALGDRAGFRGFGTDYADLRGALIHEVLHRRRGLPIMLSIVYIEVGRRLGVPVAGIGLPGHFVVAVLGEPGPVYLDPFYAGRLVTPRELAARVSELAGEPRSLTADDLRPWSPVDTMARVLGNIRAAAGRRDALRTRLWAVELSLLLPGHAPTLRRERGELLARLGDYLGAARELESYAAEIARHEPDAADLALRDARMARARLS